eukprot:gene10590-12253_t
MAFTTHRQLHKRKRGSLVEGISTTVKCARIYPETPQVGKSAGLPISPVSNAAGMLFESTELEDPGDELLWLSQALLGLQDQFEQDGELCDWPLDAPTSPSQHTSDSGVVRESVLDSEYWGFKPSWAEAASGDCYHPYIDSLSDDDDELSLCEWVAVSEVAVLEEGPEEFSFWRGCEFSGERFAEAAGCPCPCPFSREDAYSTPTCAPTADRTQTPASDNCSPDRATPEPAGCEALPLEPASCPPSHDEPAAAHTCGHGSSSLVPASTCTAVELPTCVPRMRIPISAADSNPSCHPPCHEVMLRYLTDSLRNVEGALKNQPPPGARKGGYGPSQQQQRMGAPGIPARRATTEILTARHSDQRHSDQRRSLLDNGPSHSRPQEPRPMSTGRGGHSRVDPNPNNPSIKPRHQSVGRSRGGGSAPPEPIRRSTSGTWESQAALAAKARLMAAAHRKYQHRDPGRGPPMDPRGPPIDPRGPPMGPRPGTSDRHHQHHQHPPPPPQRGPSTKPPKPAPLRPPTADLGPPVRAASVAGMPSSRVDPVFMHQHTPGASLGTNASWWKQASGESNFSYPMTAVTDREQSITGTELANFMDRINQLESAIERDRREKFQKELHKLQDGPQQASRGDVTTGGRATAGRP